MEYTEREQKGKLMQWIFSFSWHRKFHRKPSWKVDNNLQQKKLRGTKTITEQTNTTDSWLLCNHGNKHATGLTFQSRKGNNSIKVENFFKSKQLAPKLLALEPLTDESIKKILSSFFQSLYLYFLKNTNKNLTGWNFQKREF